MEKKIKPFWVMSVNNWICDADYNGKRLKEKHPVPSFRRFYFIRKMDKLKYFSTRDGITNEDLVNKCLSQNQTT